NPRDTVMAAASSLQSAALTSQKLVAQPAITTADTKQAQEKAEDMLARQVMFRIEHREFTATPADIGRWIELSPVEASKTIDVEVDSGKVLEYLDDIAAPYIAPPSSQVVLKRADG